MQIQLPDEHAAGLGARAAGARAGRRPPRSATLDQPLTDDDGDTITERVSVVEFDAAAGGGIAPGQFQEFSLSAGPFPDRPPR